ncbi:MAG: ATP phosphoribosyltransferase [Chloroflexi bacterium]|nr:ATP phosphoribosyltransferase [Chloroflexota bacterium]
MSIKIALPKGRLLRDTAALLEKAGWELCGYEEGARFYRFESRRFPGMLLKLFHEKDIPIQVAVGNYDLGICGLDWIEELLVRYPSSALVKVKDLGYGASDLYAAASLEATTLDEMRSNLDVVRIASEYPNLAESFAAHLRLRHFKVYPLWGGAEVYPPESADLALLSEATVEPFAYGLVPTKTVLSSSAFLVANKTSWETKDLSEVLSTIGVGALPAKKPRATTSSAQTPGQRYSGWNDDDTVRLALPDGHQQVHAVKLLSEAGIRIEDYPSKTGNRRPCIGIEGVVVKVIRPQDMPMQVANGNFDLAITGKDWVREQLYQFPSSPIVDLLDLKFGRVRLVAVISKELPANDTLGLRQLVEGRSAPLRVASEYINIADRYARENHLGPYRVIPTWGATEAFLPEDADLLIENTETGSTIARHNLKIIDELFVSTACLLGSTNGKPGSRKQQTIRSIVETLKGAVERMSQKPEGA